MDKEWADKQVSLVTCDQHSEILEITIWVIDGFMKILLGLLPLPSNGSIKKKSHDCGLKILGLVVDHTSCKF